MGEGAGNGENGRNRGLIVRGRGSWVTKLQNGSRGPKEGEEGAGIRPEVKLYSELLPKWEGGKGKRRKKRGGEKGLLIKAS